MAERSSSIASETANRETGTIKSKRRNDGIDARTVGEPRIHHRRRLIHAASNARDDTLDDLHQMRVVFERERGQFELARFFDVDPVVAIDQDVGDVVIFEQLLERPEAENLVENFT
jgi:hypothetical protein